MIKYFFGSKVTFSYDSDSSSIIIIIQYVNIDDVFDFDIMRGVPVNSYTFYLRHIDGKIVDEDRKYRTFIYPELWAIINTYQEEVIKEIQEIGKKKNKK